MLFNVVRKKKKNDSLLPLYIQRSFSEFKAILLAMPQKITQAILVFITPLGNTETINMMGIKSHHVYLIAPKTVTRIGADTAFSLY